MIPNGSFTSFYIKFAGEQSLLSMAQSNLISHMERVSKVRTHTFLSNNGQNKNGISQNYGEERHYTWGDTVIDCRNAPDLVDSDMVHEYTDVIEENRRFKAIKEDLESRMGGHIKIKPFLTVLRGEENMRYNIKRASKIEDFDIIRIGFKLSAEDEAAFKMGLQVLKDYENPFKMKRHIMECAEPFNA